MERSLTLIFSICVVHIIFTHKYVCLFVCLSKRMLNKFASEKSGENNLFGIISHPLYKIIICMSLLYG